MMLSAATATATVERSRARGRAALVGWLRHRPWGTAFAVLVLLAVGVRLVWGWRLAGRLETELEAVRARGEPTALDDIALETVADADNAWAAYLKAAAALHPTAEPPTRAGIEFPPYPPYGAEWEALAEASEQKNAAAFSLARAARRLPRAQLRDPPRRNPGRQVQYTEALWLAYTLADGADYAHLKARDGEAIERLLDLLHFGRSTRQDPFPISQLIAFGHENMATDSIQRVAPRLVIADGGPRDGAAATRAPVRALIAALLDETAARPSFVRAMSSERAVMLFDLEQEAGETWVIRPLAHQAALRILPDFDALVEAAGQPTHAAAQRALAPVEERRRLAESGGFGYSPGVPTRVPPRYSRWFDEHSVSPFARMLEQSFRASAERRATAVILALQLYRHDHGRWPDDLASLVPGYLDAVPTNPFLDGDRPLGYVVKRGALPEGGDRPLVYFDTAEEVGDQVDSEPMYGWQVERGPTAVRGRSMRQYRDVAPWTPTTRRFDEARRLEAEAVNDEPQEPDEPGDGDEGDGQADDPAEE